MAHPAGPTRSCSARRRPRRSKSRPRPPRSSPTRTSGCSPPGHGCPWRGARPSGTPPTPSGRHGWRTALQSAPRGWLRTLRLRWLWAPVWLCACASLSGLPCSCLRLCYACCLSVAACMCCLWCLARPLSRSPARCGPRAEGQGGEEGAGERQEDGTGAWSERAQQHATGGRGGAHRRAGGVGRRSGTSAACSRPCPRRQPPPERTAPGLRGAPRPRAARTSGAAGVARPPAASSRR